MPGGEKNKKKHMKNNYKMKTIESKWRLTKELRNVINQLQWIEALQGAYRIFIVHTHTHTAVFMFTFIKMREKAMISGKLYCTFRELNKTA